MDANSEICVLEDEIAAFCEAREWSQFHNNKDLAAAISIEAGELQEAFLWKSPDEVAPDKIKEELADVLIYALRMAERNNLDVMQIVRDKLAVNAEKYPIDKAKGVAKKYTEF